MRYTDPLAIVHADEHQYDRELVPFVGCFYCEEPIGDEEYEPDEGLARFGTMLFYHARCMEEMMAKKKTIKQRLEETMAKLSKLDRQHVEGLVEMAQGRSTASEYASGPREEEKAQKDLDEAQLDVAKRIAGLTAQNKKLRALLKKSIVIGVQQGGSSVEWYANSFDNEDDFQAAVREWNNATYDSIGPFHITLGDETSILAAIDEILTAATLGTFANEGMEVDEPEDEDDDAAE